MQRGNMNITFYYCVILDVISNPSIPFVIEEAINKVVVDLDDFKHGIYPF